MQQVDKVMQLYETMLTRLPTSIKPYFHLTFNVLVDFLL